MDKIAERPIGLYNSLSIMLLSSGLYNHVILTPMLLKAGGRDAWIGVLISSLIIPLLLFIIYYISKSTNHIQISTWLIQNFGEGVSYFLVIPIASCLFIMNCVTFKDTISWSIASYLPYTPPLVLAVFLAILCYFSCMLGIQNIAFTAGVLFPFVVILGFGIMGTNMPRKHYSYIWPSLENGMVPIWHSVIFSLGGIMELFLVLLFQQHVVKKGRLLYLIILSFVLIGITLGPLLGSIAVFGPEETLYQRYPAFELWRIATVGKYISHIDFFAIFQWLSGAFIRISFLGFLTMDLFRLQSKKTKRYFLAGLYFMLVTFALLPINEEYFFHLIEKHYTLMILIVFGGSTLLLAGLSIFRKRTEGY